MSKYDSLDVNTQLEQTIAQDLEFALNKRGLLVVHKGTSKTHAPAGLPDIVAFNPSLVLTVEVTKSKGANQDRELNAIRDHLNLTKSNNPDKRCNCLFLSPTTSTRMLDGIRDHNQQRAIEGKADLKILPLCFDTFEMWVTRLKESETDLYPIDGFIKLFQFHTGFIDDLRVRKLIVDNIFPLDTTLAEVVEKEEIERDQRTLEALIKDLIRMENYMRENGIAVGQAAIDTLIYLVFIKLYEEKREISGDTNRLRSSETFQIYRRDSVDAQTRNAKRAIHKLFNAIQHEGEFLSSQMFTPGDNLVDSVNDDFILNYVIPIFRKYKFVGTRIDALGAVYEVLALRAEKDIKVGQFFTPENIVRFMVKLAEVKYQDMVLDPACGTGRFLIYAMDDMLEKVNRSDAPDRDREREQVRLHRLFGVDIDPRIARIAKMNMWVHGDGKANIFGGREYNGLLLYKRSFNDYDSFDNAFDLVLTNPPLGDLNYRNIELLSDSIDKKERTQRVLERMPLAPRKNVTEELLKTVRKRLKTYRDELRELNNQIAVAEEEDAVQEWLIMDGKAATKETRERIQELRNVENVKAHLKLRTEAQRKKRTIEDNEAREADLDAKLRTGQEEWEITGNTMKGGAMFLTAIWHYLKDNAYPSNVPEWRGGRVLIILDEGILNTDNYRHARNYIRSHFYIKTIISLTRDTFVPVSKTTTKTSILYAVKKTDFSATQKEPTFFAHVERVGLDTKGKSCPNDLEPLLGKYFDFKKAIIESYVGAAFNRERFLAHGFRGDSL